MEFLAVQESNFTFTFKNIKYEVDVFDKEKKETFKKVIINNACGQIKSGTLSAIMGPSGSGKTSLLNFITNRIEFPSKSIHEGQVYLNSQEISFEEVPFYSSYVMQDDVLFDVLTPYENIKFGCQLKKVVAIDKVDECVNGLLRDLQLTACQNTFVGNNERKGISGGERKRTSIGMEIISNPSILFLDEPTSGLDSQTSLKIISLLKRIATEKNVAIVCTIHQPSSNIFNIFDNLIIIEKGNIIFNDSPTKIIDYFKSINKPLNERSNPADAFMRNLEENASYGKNVNYFIEQYQKYNKAYEERITKEIAEGKEGSNIKSKLSEMTSCCEAIGILAKRSLLNVVRNPMVLRSRVGFTILFGFMTASVFWKLKPDTYDGIGGRIGFFFFACVNIFMSQVMGTVLSFPVERAVFIREYSSKMYSVGEYYIAKNMVETPFIMFFTAIFAVIIYFTAGLRDDSAKHFFIFLGGILLHALCAQSLGYALGSLFARVSEAMSAVQILVMPFVLFGGTLINEETMPRWLFWIKYISPIKYMNEIGNINEFKDNAEITFGKGGNAILDQLNFDVGIGNCFIILACMNFALRFVAYLFLKMMIRKAG